MELRKYDFKVLYNQVMWYVSELFIVTLQMVWVMLTQAVVQDKHFVVFLE
jgi:hypothetical protein